MNVPYIIELNLTAFLFALPLCGFLFFLHKKSATTHPAFIRLLFVGLLMCFGETILGACVNYAMTHPPGLNYLTFGYVVVETLEALETVFFVRYIAENEKDVARVRGYMTPVYAVMAVYLIAQIATLFTGVAVRVAPDGAISGGVLLYPVVYVTPFALGLYGIALYFIIAPKVPLPRRLAVLSTWLIPLAGVFVQIFLMPQLMTTGFAFIIGDFIVYFVFETPPYKQLTDRMQELEDASARAEQAWQEALSEDRAMNEFLANMSHEIRTPLTAILGYDEVILNDATEGDVRAQAQDIMNAGNTLLYIVNDILDFSKIESGELQLTLGEYRLSETVDNIDNMIRQKASDKGLEFRLRYDGDIPDLLYGDGVRVGQIMLNLLNNAVKYTKRGFAELRLEQEKTETPDEIILKIAVTDSGVGIREEDQKKLFHSFARLDLQNNRDIEGTGLGLAITSRFLNLMDGEISVESVYGVGSTFYARIPQTVLGGGTLAEQMSSERALTNATQALAPSAKMLVVDDNLTNRTVVAELLRHTLIHIDTADSGEACLEKVRQDAYDLILLDQMMPHMSGTETLRRMRAMEQNKSKDAPVVAFTANAIAGVKERLLETGFDDYLSKPVTGADLMQMMMKHLPREALLMPGDVGYENAKAAETAILSKETKSEEQEILERLKGIDVTQALTMCGTKEVLLAAVRDFRQTIAQQADLIAHYYKSGDIHNYTVKVHALKSAARFIGARQLSDDAAYLEQCGDEGNLEEIQKRTVPLLTLYRSYLDKLAPIDPLNGEEDVRPEISKADLQEAYEELRQFVTEFDYDGADAVMDALQGYRVPDAHTARFEEIRLLLTNVDRARLLAALSEEIATLSAP